MPLLWIGVSRVAKEGTRRYKRLTVIGEIVGFVAGFFPYKTLLNILYGVNGYLGFALIAFMIVHDVRITLAKGKEYNMPFAVSEKRMAYYRVGLMPVHKRSKSRRSKEKTKNMPLCSSEKRMAYFGDERMHT